jgi:hypothetical protein
MCTHSGATYSQNSLHRAVICSSAVATGIAAMARSIQNRANRSLLFTLAAMFSLALAASSDVSWHFSDMDAVRQRSDLHRGGCVNFFCYALGYMGCYVSVDFSIFVRRISPSVVCPRVLACFREGMASMQFNPANISTRGGRCRKVRLTPTWYGCLVKLLA